MNKFLGIGINEYKGGPLRGCVPDIKDCLSNLAGQYGWDWTSMRSVTDKRAHRLGIWRRMEWLVNDSRPGDRLLLWFSGHGAQVPERNNGEVDGLTEVLCPVDFAGDDRDTWLRDDDFTSVFKKVPDGVECTVVLDSCFSGGMVDLPIQKLVRGLDIIDSIPRAYPLERNLDFDVRMRTAKAKGLKPKPFIRASEMPNVCFIFGCQENQTGADAYLDGGYRGAFSYHLWASLRQNQRLSIREIVGVTGKALADDGFSQQPTVLGSDKMLRKPFLGRVC